MGDTVARTETAGAHLEEQESRRTAATPAVDSTIAGDTRHTVIEPRTLETNNEVEADSRRSMPVRLFPDDSQQPDLGVSGDSNFWHEGYSYRQDNREKGYTIIDRGSTGSGANLPLPHFPFAWLYANNRGSG